MAVQNILSSKMRTFLTMLGIIIGVCAVIVIVGLGNGMQGYIEDSFADMGTDSLTVMVHGPRLLPQRVGGRDVPAGGGQQRCVQSRCSPTVTMSGSVKIGSSTLSATSVTGVSEDYFSMKGYEVAQGRGLQYTRHRPAAARSASSGSYVNQAYYGGNAVGQTLRVSGNTFTIVGVMEHAGRQSWRRAARDDCLFLPYSTAARLSFTGTISSLHHHRPGRRTTCPRPKPPWRTPCMRFSQDDDAYTVGSMAEMVEDDELAW